VEKVGFGPGQLLAVILACGPFLAEGLELLLVSLLSRSIHTDLDGGEVAEGLMLSAVLAGAAVGNIVAGPLADLAGRQPMILLGYAVVIVASAVSSFANAVITLSSLRLIVGLGFGLAQPPAIALMGELAPRQWRWVSIVGPAVLFCVGALCAVVMVTLEDAWFRDLSMLEWRLLLRCACIPMIALGLAAVILLPESPQFLASSGDVALARDSLRALASSNRVPDVDVSFRSFDGLVPLWRLPALGQMRDLLRMPALAITAPICLGGAIVSFTLFGSAYVVPLVLTEELEEGLHSVAPASVLLLSFCAAGAVLGLGASWGSPVGRKSGIVASLVVSFAAALLFVSSISTAKIQETWPHWGMLLASTLGLVVGPTFSCVLLSQAAADVLPLAPSACATSAWLALSHLGAVVAPLMLDRFKRTSGHSHSFFVLLAWIQIVCAILVLPVDLEQPRVGREPAKDAAGV